MTLPRVPAVLFFPHRSKLAKMVEAAVRRLPGFCLNFAAEFMKI
jgi:hypothetical protein